MTSQRRPSTPRRWLDGFGQPSWWSSPMRPTSPTSSSQRRLMPGSSGTLRGRLSGLLPSDADDQQPGAGNHEDERSHHADAHDIEAPGVTGKERDGTDLLQNEAREATNG